MPADVSCSTSPPTTIRPLAARFKPATVLRIVVLPAPEGPNRAMTRASVAIATSSRKSPWPRTISISMLIGAGSRSADRPPQTADQPFGKRHRPHGEDDRDGRQSRRRGLAARHLRIGIEGERNGLRL